MKFVAVTSCPTGIAHSQMGAEGLEQAGEELGYDIRVEIQGAMGAEDELTSEEITEADAVIIAADTSVSRDRFEGNPLVKRPVADAINEAEELLEEAARKAEEAAENTSDEPDEGTTTETGDAEAGRREADSGTTRDTSEQRGLLGWLRGLFS